MYLRGNTSGLYLVSIILAYCVIVLGAYVRLSDAGLGCPDWPGCYGKLVVPDELTTVKEINQAYPERPLEHSKAWKEMIHRYAAALLGLIILVLAIKSWLKSSKEGSSQMVVPTVLLLMVIFQALLGMWTVTLLLKPVIVTAHLLGGMAILSLLYWQFLLTIRPLDSYKAGNFTVWIIMSVLVVFFQIALGGWTSANYSALICTDFPTCQGQWWPMMSFSEGFTLWRGLGIDYEGGVLDASARTAIHVSHRLGAVLTFVFVFSLAISAFMSNIKRLQRIGVVVMLILLIQVSLGITNILLLLPLPVAVAHNGVAALLLLSIITMLNFSYANEGH